MSKVAPTLGKDDLTLSKDTSTMSKVTPTLGKEDPTLSKDFYILQNLHQ